MTKAGDRHSESRFSSIDSTQVRLAARSSTSTRTPSRYSYLVCGIISMYAIYVHDGNASLLDTTFTCTSKSMRTSRYLTFRILQQAHTRYLHRKKTEHRFHGTEDYEHHITYF